MRPIGGSNLCSSFWAMEFGWKGVKCSGSVLLGAQGVGKRLVGWMSEGKEE